MSASSAAGSNTPRMRRLGGRALGERSEPSTALRRRFRVARQCEVLNEDAIGSTWSSGPVRCRPDGTRRRPIYDSSYPRTTRGGKFGQERDRRQASAPPGVARPRGGGSAVAMRWRHSSPCCPTTLRAHTRFRGSQRHLPSFVGHGERPQPPPSKASLARVELVWF